MNLLIKDESIIYCMSLLNLNRIHPDQWLCPECNTPTEKKIGMLDGGSRKCPNKQCPIENFHWCALIGKYSTESPIHHTNPNN